MMDHTQLELDFEGCRTAPKTPSCQVVEFSAFSLARQARLQQKSEAEKAQLVAEIVKSVEHITGRSPDAEAM